MGFFDYFTKQASDVGPLPEGEKSGFFGTSWDDPRTQANMALFAGLLSGGGNKGFAGALGQGVENMSGAMSRYNEQKLHKERQQLAKEQMEWERARQEKIDAQPDPKQMERYRINQLLTRSPATIGGHHAVQGGNMGEVDVNQEPLPYAGVQMNRANAVMGEYPDLGMKFAEEARKASEQPKNNDTPLMKTMRAQGIVEGSKEWIDTLNSERLDASGQAFRIPGYQQAATERALASAGIAQANKAPTEFEHKIAIYSQSMRKASSELMELDEKGVTPGVLASVIPDWVPGRPVTQSTEQQLLERAGKQWIDSINRIRSGAAMPEIEYERAASVYLPRLGEDKATRATKAQARAAEEAFLRDIENRVTGREAMLRGGQGGIQAPQSAPMAPQPPTMQMLPRGVQQQPLPTYEDMKRLYGQGAR